MKLSVVIGTYNRRAQLEACLASIFGQTLVPVRVYVTDAGSTDGTIQYLQSMASERLVCHFSGKKIGQARAYNEIFARIETPYVCWLSDDNVIVNRGLDLAARILDAEHTIGMVALKVKDMSGPFVDAPYIGGMSAIGILNVNQGVLRSPIMKEVGGFSETFEDYGIDPDLTAKVLFSGHAVAYTRQIALHHYRNWNADPTSEDYARQMAKQDTYLELYQRKYGALAARGVAWRLKKVAWQALQKTIGLSLNSERPFMGLLPRDWYNILMGRYITLIDPLRCRAKPYYLLQDCPHRHRLRFLSFDVVDPNSSLPHGASNSVSDAI